MIRALTWTALVLWISLIPPVTGYGAEPDVRELPGGRVGAEYQLSVPVRGGTPPYRWRVLDPEHLPPGVKLVDGELRGTLQKEGEYVFTIEVHDAERAVARKKLQVRVEPLGLIKPLRIRTEKLPSAAVNMAFDVALAAEGGIPPYRWSIEKGALPKGLEIQPDGLVTGSPKETTTASFTVKVADSQGTSAAATRQLTFAVLAVEAVDPLWWLKLAAVVLAAVAVAYGVFVRRQRRKEELARKTCPVCHEPVLQWTGDRAQCPKGHWDKRVVWGDVVPENAEF